jgi:hypothetical protein
VLDQIQYLAENGLTSLMVLHDFLSRGLVPLQDRPTHLAWMYTGVNDIMRLEYGPGSSLDEALLATSLKALTADQFLAYLVVPTAVYEPICANQAVRTTLLTTMPTLDQSHIMVIPGLAVWSAPLVVRAGVAARRRPRRCPDKRRPDRRLWRWSCYCPQQGQTTVCRS